MVITKTIDTDKATLVVEGCLDDQTAPDFESELASIPDEVLELSLDCSGLAHISPAGVAQLEAAYNRFSHLVLWYVSPEHMEALRQAGIDKKLHIVF